MEPADGRFTLSDKPFKHTASFDLLVAADSSRPKSNQVSRVHNRNPSAHPEPALQIPEQRNDQPGRQTIEPLVTDQVGKQLAADLPQAFVECLVIAVLAQATTIVMTSLGKCWPSRFRDRVAGQKPRLKVRFKLKVEIVNISKQSHPVHRYPRRSS